MAALEKEGPEATPMGTPVGLPQWKVTNVDAKPTPLPVIDVPAGPVDSDSANCVPGPQADADTTETLAAIVAARAADMTAITFAPPRRRRPVTTTPPRSMCAPSVGAAHRLPPRADANDAKESSSVRTSGSPRP